MGDSLIKINAKIQAYTKGIFPAFPQPTQYDIGKLLGVDEQGKYALLEPVLTKQQAQQIIDKLETIEPGAQVNKIDCISINGRQLPISGKQINFPIADTTTYGVVKSSYLDNRVFVLSDGQMEINSVDISKIVQNSGQDIVLDCTR